MTGLTPLQHDTLEAIKRLGKGGICPSFGELSEDLGIAKSGVHRVLSQLEDRGMLRRLPNRARSIELLPTALGPPELVGLTSAELRTTAAHIAGILAYREGSEHAHDVFDRIAKRIGQRPLDGGHAS